jgi:hypothetical protein
MSLKNLYTNYRCTASARGIQFLLSVDDFNKLVKGECRYCGVGPSRVRMFINNPVIYNGIDRVDSDRDYTVDNCVSCCSFCNTLKSDMSEKEFYTWINKIKISKSTPNILEYQI